MASLTSRTRWQIRRIFLQRHRDYSPTEAAQLLSIPRAEIVQRIEEGELDAERNVTLRLRWRTIAYLALMKWREEMLFEALGDEADEVLPPLMRLETLSVRVPAYMVRMLVWGAKHEGVSIDEHLRVVLHEFANGFRSEHPEVDMEIPGFSDALMFPDVGRRR